MNIEHQKRRTKDSKQTGKDGTFIFYLQYLYAQIYFNFTDNDNYDYKFLDA